MSGKLLLPFILLSDARGDLARLYGLWNENEGVAVPSIIVVDQSREIKYLYAGSDFADRPGDEEVFAALDGLDSPAGGSVGGEPEVRLLAGNAASESVRPNRPPMSLDLLVPYYQGTYFATVALKNRLGGLGRGGGKALGEIERYQQMISGYRDAIRQTIKMKS